MQEPFFYCSDTKRCRAGSDSTVRTAHSDLIFYGDFTVSIMLSPKGPLMVLLLCLL